MRDWPRTGFRRVEDVQDDTVTLERDVDNNIPTSVDIRSDSSAILNTLVVRDGSSMSIANAKADLQGVSYSREHYSIEAGRAYATTNVTDACDETYDQNDGGIRGVLPALERFMIGEGARAAEGFYNANIAANDSPGIAYDLNDVLVNANNWLMLNQGDGSLMGAHGLAIVGSTNDVANGVQARQDPRRMLQALLTGRVGQFNIPGVSFCFSDYGAHRTGGVSHYGNLTQAMAVDPETGGVPHANRFQTQAQRRRLFLDKAALEFVPTSAMDFVHRWQDDLIALSQNMGYYKSEFIGFFEKGQRAQFWQRFTQPEIMLIGWLAMLGKAMRTGSWSNNLFLPAEIDDISGEDGTLFQNVSDDDAGDEHCVNVDNIEFFGGCYCPFFLRLEDAGGATIEYSPWWVASQIDNSAFENTHTETPQYGIYQEDVFSGLDMLLDAASYEAGIAWRSVGKGYLDFFEDFKTATLPDFRSNEARTSEKALKTLSHLGFESVDEWFALGGIAPVNRPTTAFFNQFTEGQLVIVDQQDLLKRDLEELGQLQIINGSRFSEGMQLTGKSQFSVHHRRTTDGNSHSISLSYSPECFARTCTLTPSLHVDLAASTDVLIPANLRLTGDVGGVAFDVRPRGLNTAGTSWVNELAAMDQGVRCVLWPSSGQGWAVYTEEAFHTRNHAFVGAAGLLEEQPGVWGTGYGYGAPTYPNGAVAAIRVTPGNTDADGSSGDTTYHATTPLFPEEHWRLGMEGIAVRLLRSLSVTYKHWQNRSNLLPFKSQFKGLEFSGINLVSMLTMETGENLVQKNLPAILGIGHCSQNGNWSLSSRHIDRQLDDLGIHLRPQRWADLAGADLVAQYLPVEADTSSLLDAFAMYNYMAYLTGTIGKTNLLTGVGAVTVPALGSDAEFEVTHPLYHEIHMYPQIHTTDLHGSNLRTIYIPATGNNIGMTIDGELMSKTIVLNGVVPAGQAVFPVSTLRGLFRCEAAHANSVPLPSEALVFDFFDEIVDTFQNLTQQNSAHLVPGSRYSFEALWTNSDPAAPAALGNSACSLFGMTNVPLGAGSNVDGLLGWSQQPPELNNVIPIAAVAAWDSWHWAQYVQTRKGELVWQEMQPQIVIWDQDILDLDMAMLSVMWFFNSRRIIHGYCPYLAVIDASAEVKTVHQNVFEITSGGGVATESGGFTGAAESGESFDDPRTVGGTAADRADD